jgi:integrase
MTLEDNPQDSDTKVPATGLTDKFCKGAKLVPPRDASGKPSQRLYFDKPPDAPRGFALRVTSAGARSFVLNYHINGKQRRLTVGAYPTLSLAAARKLAFKLANRVQAGEDPLEQRRQAAAAREAEAAERKARKDYTLAALLDAYVGRLEIHGKHSAPAVRALVKRALQPPGAKTEHAKKCAALATMPARDATPKALMPLFDGLPPQSARKFRAALRAAFTLAAQAQTDASLRALEGFDIHANPVAALKVSMPPPTPERVKQLEHTLKPHELAAYWSRLKGMETPQLALAALHLLTGAQRPQQLVRATLEDLDREAQTLTLWDPKGRRSAPRKHVVPLLPDAMRAIEAMNPDKGEHLVTLTRGRKAADAGTLTRAVGAVAQAMKDAGEVSQPFTPATLRKTVETLLSADGVPPEHRDFLQSHNLGSLTVRHYNRHDFLPEKRRALETLWALLQPLPPNVSPIASKRRGAK